MNKTIKLSFAEEDLNIIKEEASSRLLKPSAFIKLCIASYINKGSQRRVFQKSGSNDSQEKKITPDPKY